jgi:hypothetical protein
MWCKVPIVSDMCYVINSSEDSSHSEVPWPFSLVVEIIRDNNQYQYIPSSNFALSVESFPYLLLAVASQKGDLHRLLLQASCLVRLGNALLTDKSPTFSVKAIHVDKDYYAAEYTLYQRGLEPRADDVVFFYLLPHVKRD